MKKLIFLILAFLISCAPVEEVIKKELAVKDIRAPKTKAYLPIICKPIEEGKWVQSINTSGDFGMDGVYLNGKVYIGGYGDGKIYSYSPLITEINDTGESILGLAVFQNKVFATSENNNMQGQHTRVFKKNGGWSEIGINGYAAFFTTVWNNNLIVTSTRNLNSIDVNISSDGNSFGRMATFEDWLWVPVTYKNELYVLGHSGGPGGPGYSKAVKWNGSSFVNVPALSINSVNEWQCATEHNGYLYLGSGGWTLNRGNSVAGIYRFDGTNVVQVKSDSNFNETQALLSSRGALYASMGRGFKSTGGSSKIWVMRNDVWKESGFFPNCPLLYALVETPSGYVAAGGRLGSFMLFDNAIVPK